MSRFVAFLFLFLIIWLLTPQQSFAIENPLSRPNNKIGIHILFDTELSKAAKLVNANGGDWGYVTIPLQITDRDPAKWQRFMKAAKKYHIIPIIRLATEADPTNTKSWRVPTRTDIVDFAQFLEKLEWPTKNKYLVLFNEVNRGDEWGSAIDPAAYADLLSFAVTVFKSKDQDYFIISAGLDNAAPNQANEFMNQYEYMKAMNTALPGIFNQIDGLSSHSYPNPGFAQPPDEASSMGIGSFRQERELAKSLSNKELPIFITETGWDTNALSEEQVSTYYEQVFSSTWNDPGIVAITPFLLDARGGPFQKFSFMTPNGAFTKQYEIIKNLLKTKGAPGFPIAKVLAAETANTTPTPPAPVNQEKKPFFLSKMFRTMLQWLKG